MAGTRYFGVAEEAVYGTKVAADADFMYEDVADVGLDVPDKQALIYQGITRRMSQMAAKGAYIPKGDCNMPVDGVLFGWILKWLLGDYVRAKQSEGGLEVYQHTFQDGNVLKSFTARVGKELLQHVFQGCKITSVKIDINNKDFAKATVAMIAQKDTKEDIQDEADIVTTEVSFYSFVHGSISIGGTPYDVESINIEINNNIKGEDGMRVGSRFPKQLDINDLDIKVSVQAPFGVLTHLTNYWNNASTPTSIVEKAIVIGLTSDDTEIVLGSGKYYALALTLPRCIYDGVSQTIKGRDRMVQKLDMSALFDQTAGYGIQAVITTSFPAYALETFFRSISATSAIDLWACGTRGKIYHTADGALWAAQATGLTGYESTLNCIRMFDSTHGYACGQGGKILHSADGATWTDVSPVGVTTYFYGLHVESATTAWVCGAGGKIYKTSDSGTTWVSKTSGVTANLYAITGTTGLYVAVGAGGIIVGSADGTTWATKTSGKTVDLLCVASYNDTTDLIIAGGEAGCVLTSAAGTAWADKSITGCTEDIRGISALSLTTALAVGNNAKAYNTVNAGTAWTAVDTGQENIDFYGAAMVGANDWMICGTFENVLITDDAGDTFTAQAI